MSSALKQLEEYRRKQSQRYIQSEELDMKIEEELKRQKEEEERKRKQELDDIELARKLQEDLDRAEKENQSFKENQEEEEESAFQEEHKFNNTPAPPQPKPINTQQHNQQINNTNAQYQQNHDKPPSALASQNNFPNFGDHQQTYQQEQPTIRPPDQYQVDRLIPDENELNFQDQIAYQQFLMQQQILLQEIEERKKKSTSRQVNQQNEQTRPLLSNDQRHTIQRPSNSSQGMTTNNRQPNQDQFIPLAGMPELTEARRAQENRRRVMIISGITVLMITLFSLFVIFFVAN